MTGNKCEICNREFEGPEALQQHNLAKHSSSEKAKLKKKSSKFPVIIIIILIIGGAYYMMSQKPAYAPEHIKGNPNGSITVIEFSDFQCPACLAAYPEAKDIVKEYGDKVKFVYKHFPLNDKHPYAFKAAEASECASEQGKFWEYHDKLFDNQNLINFANLKQFALDMGLNTTEFNKCLDSGMMGPRVTSNQQEGRGKPLEGTPTFFVNGKKNTGVLTLEKFKQIAGL